MKRPPLDYQTPGARQEAQEEGILKALLVVVNLLTAAVSILSLGWLSICLLNRSGRNPESELGVLLFGGSATLLLAVFGGGSLLWAVAGPKRSRGELLVVFIPLGVTLAMLVMMVLSDVLTR